MNFEDPSDKTSVSTMTFGEFDFTQVEAGEKGLNYYNNIGTDNWAVMMDDLKYGDVEI